MSDHEVVQERHPVASDEPTREGSIEAFELADKESGFSRRTLVRNSLFGALIAFPLPGITLLRSLAPQDQDPTVLLKHTMWDKGVRLARDHGGSAVGAAIKASEVTNGSVFHVVPENLGQATHPLDEKAKAIVLLMRLDPSSLIEPEDRKGWEIADGGGDLVFFPPHSWWPLWCALAFSTITYAIAMGAWWLVIIGFGLGAVALSGWVFEYYRGEHAH